MRLFLLGLISGLHCYQVSASCAATKEEHQVRQYVERRVALVADGTLKKQIEAGTYDADSLSLEMYEWWVQLGLSSHGLAIDSFVNMITNAGSPQQKPPSKDWAPLISQWAYPIMNIADQVSPMVSPLFGIIYLGVLSYQTAALAAADPSQGGSTDFLRAAERWRSELPSETTSHLLMIHDFINNLKNDDMKNRLVPAYDLVTKLINATQSYRQVYNAYYMAYLNHTVPHKDIWTSAMVYQGYWPWEKTSVTQRTLWAPTPAGLDGCVLKQDVMAANGFCIDASTPAMGKYVGKALLINVVYDSAGFRTWQGLEYACDEIDIARHGNTQIGCIKADGKRYSTTDKDDDGNLICTNWRLAEDKQTTVFEQLRAACAKPIDGATEVVTYNYVNFTGATGDYAIAEFRKESDFTKHTCKQSGVLVV